MSLSLWSRGQRISLSRAQFTSSFSIYFFCCVGPFMEALQVAGNRPRAWTTHHGDGWHVVFLHTWMNATVCISEIVCYHLLQNISDHVHIISKRLFRSNQLAGDSFVSLCVQTDFFPSISNKTSRACQLETTAAVWWMFGLAVIIVSSWFWSWVESVENR